MKRFSILIILLLLTSCAFKSNKKDSQKDINFSTNMTFNDFKLSLEKYAEESTYPNLDD